ncbi:hypothetical protein PMKS-002709 [Pichia membranifaciens]|uniref:Uncharacterized protein n=1 Tax=Pichia membranifaciens TaxID=4926 RepID=A0A1Q2YI57_9ASCO|nr:hypothetical protein PMKS-002709 [Pichia membranifaciens]
MKDDGNKSNRQKQTHIEKHERYINGLDCSNCEVRWCDKQCKDLDFKHILLNHRPSNKSASHAFFDVDGNEKDIFYFDKWTKLKNLLVSDNLDVVYNTFMCIIHMYHDPNLGQGFESLRCVTCDSESQLENYISSWNILKVIDLKTLWESFTDCFKKLNMTYLKFLKYMVIFKLNNYDGSIYLIFSALTKSDTLEPNVKVEYYDGVTQYDYEEFSVRTGEDNAVHMIKEHVVDRASVKPIYTNRSSGILDKKVIQVSNTSRISTTAPLVLPNEDFSNPADVEDDEIEFLSDGESDTKIPKIVLPVLPSSTQKNTTPKIRAASFTSSGASFGEGIIKYNRDQIREMLENMSHSMRLDEESSDEAEDAIDDEISSSVGSSMSRNIVSIVKNLQVNNTASQRRKSVKFEEKVTTI